MGLEVPIPKRMSMLRRDSRGYPIPFNVLRDVDGKPFFAINDDRVRARCLKEKRCAICGYRLDKLMWLVGGPLSAFHENGCYQDTPLHHDCMTYALQVCPYLSMPNYLGRIDAAGLDPAKLPAGMPAVLVDHTQIAERPEVFVAVAILKYAFTDNGYIKPERPYKQVEYWRDGKQVSLEEVKL